jgi:hypothetical protein
MTHIDDDEFENTSTDIQQNVQNTLDRVVDDYSHHWKGVIGETLQNSFDAWCSNRFDRKVIPVERELRVRLSLDVDARSFTSQDNAGGMPKSTFYNDFPGLDTPGEEKRDGNSGGKYGRGFHVVGQLGSEAYAETYHDHFRGGLVVRRARQAEVSPKYNITSQGTMVKVEDADVEVLLDLADWDQVQQYVRERFQQMVARDDVTIEYEIDGEVREITPVDLSSFDILYEEEEVSFKHGGKERTLENVVVYDATLSDQSVPFEGISLLKRNKHLSEPFMRVHEYKPRQVKHLDKMFGFADASSLCPKYENNAHNRLKGNAVTNTPLKEILEQIEQEHFIGTPTNLQERGEIVDTTLEVVNRVWESNPFEDEAILDTDGGVPGQLPAPETLPEGGPTPGESVETPLEGTDQKVDETGDSVDDTSDDPTDVESVDIDLDLDGTDKEPGPMIKCSTREDRVNINEGYTIWTTVENPEGSSYTDFDVTARIYPPGESDLEQDLEQKQFSVQPGEGTSGEDHWEVTPDVSGEYRVSAELAAYENGETLNTSTVTFQAGDPDSEEDETATDEDGEHSQPRVSFLEDIKFVRADGEDDFRAELKEGDQGMILVPNSGHPEWKHAVKQDGTTEKRNRILTLIRWANEAIVHRMLFDELEAQLDGVEDEDGNLMSDRLGGFVREELINHVSELVAVAHREVEA